MVERPNKQLREQREFETLFKNPQHARAMWSQTIADRYSRPAFRPIIIVDKDGVPTKESQIEAAMWDNLVHELSANGLSRLPTEGEMMEACQSYYARHNAAAYVARRDSMGAKPIDETKQSISINNPLENLTDEELEVMRKALDNHHAKLEAESDGLYLSESEICDREVIVQHGYD